MTRGQAGFTLIELMVSMVISSVLMAAGLSMGQTIMGSYRDHRRMSLTQRSARVSLDVMVDAVRNASPGVPSGTIVDLVACGPTGALQVIDNEKEPDELQVIYGSGGSLTSLRGKFVADSTGLLVND